VRDFAPYIAKIKASGADTVITGNWGSDLSLLIKAAIEGGYNGKFFTYYTGVTGTPTALGTNGAGRIFQIAYSHYNMGGQMETWHEGVQARKYNDDFYTGSVIRMLSRPSVRRWPRPSPPIRSRLRLRDGRHVAVKSINGEVDDAQDRPPAAAEAVHDGVAEADAKFPYSPENTGMTLVPVKEYLRTVRVEHADQLPDEAAGS
jgi:branched-chain amino acid transport system substrate-binding protein